MKWAARVERLEAAAAVMVAGGLAGMTSIALFAVLVGFATAKDRERPGLALAAAGLLVASIAQWAVFRILVQALQSRGEHALWRATHGFAHGNFAARRLIGVVALLMAAAIVAIADFWPMVVRFRDPSLGQWLFRNALLAVMSVGAAFTFNAYVLAFLRAWAFPRPFVRGFYRFRYPLDLLLALVAVWVGSRIDVFNTGS